MGVGTESGGSKETWSVDTVTWGVIDGRVIWGRGWGRGWCGKRNWREGVRRGGGRRRVSARGRGQG